MVRVGVVISDVYNLNYKNISKLAATCLATHIDEFKQGNDGQFDIILRDKIQSSHHLDDILGTLYNSVREYLIGERLDLLPINIFLGNFNRGLIHWDFLYVMDGDLIRDEDGFEYDTLEIISNTKEWIEIRTPDELNAIENFEKDHNRHKVSALGGTFDHLHDGHKILLTVAAFLTSERLIIGLTIEELLVNKKYKDFVQDFDTRRENVVSFLNTFKPSLKIEIIPLKDVCGPTGTVPEIECLVVSRETVKGGEIVNKTRKERGMSQLDLYIVNVLGGKEEDGWKEKMSSTDIRKLVSSRKDYSAEV
ncbi:similar to Saccharomyces cerevisiae YGR277C CAB4 Probable pantetheine-phosphate adenylyltransferase (PPAT) [Maudiozyma saulgeensis]|uniref:Similar to Saccharomyces cerevisiae YGR277C CAB4 Probable pantetheine-phosphate adenylyltransferase (PPAT) n=1 Tax=Maudiozyma saulgeensis TaxID=1789683 RepID=A0A1X7R9Q9_9SACH|nr:similar to Saccharomyces cerevisiae YGR277C CAB4 Probable pantetheine-phosphate adenylyltransferase (PPAT) [Kazachstania saulgeensis]